MTMARNHKIDFTNHSAVIVCSRPGCLWRCGATDRRSAWRLYAGHCLFVHHDPTSARDARKHAGAPNYVS